MQLRLGRLRPKVQRFKSPRAKAKDCRVGGGRSFGDPRAAVLREELRRAQKFCYRFNFRQVYARQTSNWCFRTGGALICVPNSQ